MGAFWYLVMHAANQRVTSSAVLVQQIPPPAHYARLWWLLAARATLEILIRGAQEQITLLHALISAAKTTVERTREVLLRLGDPADPSQQR